MPVRGSSVQGKRPDCSKPPPRAALSLYSQYDRAHDYVEDDEDEEPVSKPKFKRQFWSFHHCDYSASVYG